MGWGEPWANQQWGYHSLNALSSSIPRTYVPQTQGASAFSFSSHAPLLWGSGIGEEESVKRKTYLGHPPSASFPWRRRRSAHQTHSSLHSLRPLVGFGASEPSSLKFLCKIFLFMLQQYDTAPYAHESAPGERLHIRLAEELTTTGFSKLSGGHMSQLPRSRKGTDGVCIWAPRARVWGTKQHFLRPH